MLRRHLAATSLFAGLASIALLSRQAPGGLARPNVLLVSIDSLRRDHVTSYGYARPTTPTIDAIARDGARFDAAVSASSWTLPSHVTLFTSLPPEGHGVVGANQSLSEDAVTLAEVLRDRGYDNVAFVAAPFLHSGYGLAQGFARYDESMISDFWTSTRIVTSPRAVTLVADYLRTWDAGGRAKPFFVFPHLWDVHYDFNPPPPYDTMFDPSSDGTKFENFILNANVNPQMPPRDRERLLALYDGEIRFTDDHLGKVLDELRRRDVLDDTIVVVLSDHGEEFFEHGRKGHGEALYDETIRIPLVVRYPRTVPPDR